MTSRSLAQRARAMHKRGATLEAIAAKLELPPSHVARMLERGDRGRPSKGGIVVRARVPDAAVAAAKRSRVTLRAWVEDAIGRKLG